MSTREPIIYESVIARAKDDPRAFWSEVLRSGLKLALIWLLVAGVAVVLLITSEAKDWTSAGRMAVGLAGAALLGLFLGAFIEASGRELYLHEVSLVIRQTGYRRLRSYTRQSISIRRFAGERGFDRVEMYVDAAQAPVAILWIRQQDADRLEAWLNAT